MQDIQLSEMVDETYEKAKRSSFFEEEGPQQTLYFSIHYCFVDLLPYSYCQISWNFISSISLSLKKAEYR